MAGRNEYAPGDIDNYTFDEDVSAERVSLVTALNRNDDGITNYEKGYTTVNLTASGQILAAPGQIRGFYVSSTSSGTLRIADNTAAGSGYLQAAATPAVGWHDFPAILAVGGYVTIANTIDVTFFVRED